MSPALKMGTIFANLSCCGKHPWTKDKLIICTRIGVKIGLFSFITVEGTSSHPVEHTFRLSMILETSLSLQGLRNIVLLKESLIYFRGSESDLGIFLSRVVPILVKKLLKCSEMLPWVSVLVSPIVYKFRFYFRFFPSIYGLINNLPGLSQIVLILLDLVMIELTFSSAK